MQRRTLHRAKQRKGERGEYAGSSIAVGFMLDDKRKYLVPCPVWCDVITWLFRRYRELDGSLYELYTEIRGTCLFPTLPDDIQARVGYIQLSPVPGGYTISSQSALKYILVNPIYLGHKVYRKRIVKYNAHQPLTSKDNYEYALARLGEVDLVGGRTVYRVCIDIPHARRRCKLDRQ